MCTVAGESKADHAVEDIDRGRTQVKRFIGKAQSAHTTQDRADTLCWYKRILRVGTGRVEHADIRITERFCIQDAIAKRVINKPDGGTTAGKMNDALEHAAVWNQLFDMRAGRFKIIVHQAGNSVLLEH